MTSFMLCLDSFVCLHLKYNLKNSAYEHLCMGAELRESQDVLIFSHPELLVNKYDSRITLKEGAWGRIGVFWPIFCAVIKPEKE